VNARDDSKPHPSAAPAEPVAFGPFVLDAAQARLTRDGQVQPLNGRPLAVLAALMARAGQLMDKDAVLDAVWGHRHVTESALKGAVNTLRAALGDDARAPLYVETVPRRGYRFIGEVRPLVAAAASSPGVGPAPTPAAASTGNLPPHAGELVGREADAARLAAMWREHRLVTLTGLGGVGKTRLALAVAVAGTAGDAAPDGTWLLRLDTLGDAEPLVATLAQTLRLGTAANASAEVLGRALAPLQLRLLLDNAEHLVDAVAALVATLLAAAPQLRVLVTSQVPLRLAGEQVLPLAPLALPAAIADAAPDPAGYAAARLFCARVRQLLPGHTPTATEHADIAAICRALDGVPLALELAAARVPLLGVGGVRARLDQRFAMLTRAPRDAAARHRTLSAALDWTCGLLSDAERTALQQLALCGGSFTAEAAELLLGGDDALDLVEALRERSLVVAEDGADGQRLRLFDSVRRHALAQLADGGGGGGAAARTRHLAWMRERFEHAEREELSTPLLRWLPPLRLEIDNLRSALHFGLAADAPEAVRDEALRLLAASGPFWYRSGLRSEGARWFATARGLAAGAAARTLLEHADGVFVAYAQIGSPAEALAALRRSRPVLLANGDTRRGYVSLYAERMLLLRLDPRQPSDALLQQMRALVQPGWGALERRLLGMLEALAARDRGDFEGYHRICADMLEPCRAAGASAELWPLENGLGQALALMGRLDEACALLARTLVEVRRAGMLREQVPVLAIAASIGLLRGADADALSLAREALSLLRADGMVWWMADALPWAAWHQGRAADAARLQTWADALVQARGDSRGPLFRLLREGMAQLQVPPASAGPALDDEAAIALALGPGADAGHIARP